MPRSLFITLIALLAVACVQVGSAPSGSAIVPPAQEPRALQSSAPRLPLRRGRRSPSHPSAAPATHRPTQPTTDDPTDRATDRATDGAAAG